MFTRLMFDRARRSVALPLTFFCILVWVAIPGPAWADDTDASQITVYYSGKKRVHAVGCPRLTTDPDELAKLTKMTLAEAEAQGYPLCSKCPGSSTDQGGSSEAKTSDAGQPADDVPVYNDGGKRVHAVGCPRLTTDPDELAKLTKMTYAEAQAKGMPLCSKCPQIATDQGGSSQTPNSDSSKPADDTIVYSGGKKRVHVAECKRMPTDPADVEVMTQMTLAEAQAQGLQLCSKCPVSSTDQGGSSGSKSSDSGQPADDAPVYNDGGKRVHAVGCPRLTTDPDELAKLTKMTYAEAQAKGMPLCSKCPQSSTDQGGSSGAKASDAGQPADDTPVYNDGGKRVHAVGCPRLTTDPDELAELTKMTYAEAQAKGMPLCSKCPGSAQGDGGNAAGDLKSWVKPAPDSVPQHEFVSSPFAPLVSMGADGKLMYRAYSQKGDQLMDWSHCGYRNSSVPLPDAPVVVTLEPLAGETQQIGNLAYPMGPDSHDRIQAAIDKVAAMATEPGVEGIRGAVLLQRGTYYVTGGIQVPSGVVLRGEGDDEDGTILIMRSVDGGGNAIELGQPEAEIEAVGEANAVKIVDAYVPSGSLNLTLADTNPFEVGDFVYVRKTVNQAWIDLLGMGERLQHIRGGKEGASKRPWKPESYRFRHLRQIVDIDGKQITLDGILPQSFDQKHGSGDVYKVNVDRLGTNAGIEALQIVSNYDTMVEDQNKESNFLNFNNGIVIVGTYDSWVRDCTIKHVVFAAVNIQSNTRQITVRDTKALAPVGPDRGGKRYAFNISGGTLHLFYNCYSEDGRHDFALGSRQTGPFAFVNCTAVRGEQSEPHHRWSSGALYDNVVTSDGTLAAINRGDSGSGHGWAAANTMFWNCDAKSIVVMDPETEGENNFAIGFRGSLSDEFDTQGLMYANTRSGYWGTPQVGKYYGYALMGSGHIESPDRMVEPQSLFTQQLIDRIGADRANAVLRSGM